MDLAEQYPEIPSMWHRSELRKLDTKIEDLRKEHERLTQRRDFLFSDWSTPKTA